MDLQRGITFNKTKYLFRLLVQRQARYLELYILTAKKCVHEDSLTRETGNYKITNLPKRYLYAEPDE